VAQRVPAS